MFRTTVQPGALSRIAEIDELTCRFLPTEPSGTTPKFDCELADGTRIKVKYGKDPEIQGELAASRLLEALGFGADHMVLARRVHCFGCPISALNAWRLARWTHTEDLLERSVDYDAARDYEFAAVEYKLAGTPVDDGSDGWAFWELDRIDAARGGATRDEVDALRLMAVFLAHWDNKSGNQRLVCLPPRDQNDCTRPLVMLQDVGATFGPVKVNLRSWRDTPVWADDTGCRVTMRDLPYHGGTFPHDVHISEGGRRLLAARLAALQPSDITALFTASRFPEPISSWAGAFQSKVEQIASRTCDTGT